MLGRCVGPKCGFILRAENLGGTSRHFQVFPGHKDKFFKLTLRVDSNAKKLYNLQSRFRDSNQTKTPTISTKLIDLDVFGHNFQYKMYGPW